MASKKYQRLKQYLGTTRTGIVHDRLYDALKRALVVGEFAPGEKLTVRGLAEAFGTSPMPVREAMRRLVADQALEQRANRSIVVPPVSVERLSDLRRVRMAIEGLAAEWAATTISDEEINQLEEIQARMRSMAQSGNAADYLAANRDFHFLVYGAARSGVLLPVIESLWLQAGPYLTIMRGEATLGMGLDHHDALIAALRSGNGLAARLAIAHDIGEAADITIRASSRVPSSKAEAA
jgi:DNA-binding GntR family transcriptional regulator